MGTETLLPGAAIPVHRHLSQDEVLFIHKGQGRATLEGKSMTVLPGAMLYVPRQAWHGLRNTGTGLLQFTWTAAPPGIEEFFREMSKLGPQADAAALAALAQRHGLEFHPEGEAAPPSGHQPHRRHRGRRGDRGRAQPQPSPTQPHVPAPAVASQPAAASSSGQPRPRRRRRRRHGRPAQPAAAGTTAPGAAPSQPAKAPARRPFDSAQGGVPSVLRQAQDARPERSRGTSAVEGRRPQGKPRPRRGRVKEVYMDGRWVQVSGEGPVIAPGRDRSREGRSRAGRDEDTPAGPLSVPL